MDVSAAVGFLHLTHVPVEVGVRPADEGRSLPLTVLVAIPETFLYRYLDLHIHQSPREQWKG